MRTRPAIERLSVPLAVAALITLIAPGRAHAEEIVLPYTCQMLGGRPALTPSPPQAHRIVGSREDRRVTVCSPADPGRCRAWTAHRFDMLCSGVEVPWAAVVANSPPGRNGAAWIENGRFRLSMPPAWALPTENPCSRLIDDRDPGLERYCANQPRPSQPSYVEMPAGFAPMFGLNGSFSAGPSSSAPSTNAYSPPRPDALPPVVTPGGNLNWRASPVAPPQPLPPQPDATAAAPPSRKKPAALPPVASTAEPALKPGYPAAREDDAASASSPGTPPAVQPIDPFKPAIRTGLPKVAPAKIEPTKIEPLKPEAKAGLPNPGQFESAKAEPPAIEPPKPESEKPAASAAPIAPAAAPAPTPAPVPAPPIAAAPVTSPPAALPPAQATAAPPPASTQVAAARTTREPFSSRPVKLANPDDDLRTGLMIAGSVALTLTLVGAAFIWRRRSQSAYDDADPVAWTQHGRNIDPPAFPPATHTVGFHDGITLPGLPISPTPQSPAPPAHAVEPQFDDPFGRMDAAPEAPPTPLSGHRSSTGHTLPMMPLDGVRTHLDADPDFEPPYGELPADSASATAGAPSSLVPPSLKLPTQTRGYRNPHDIPYEDAPLLGEDQAPALETQSPPPLPSRDGALAVTPPPPPSPAFASASGAASWPTGMMPQTRDDALHILGMGVSARASLPAMKKIVDGLRLTWHPDHATDAADRAIREQRIRQINLAWDLIAQSHPGHDPAV